LKELHVLFEMAMEAGVLTEIRPYLAAAGAEGAPSYTERVINVAEGERTVVIGTLFKDMPLRPSVLDEYRDEMALGGAARALLGLPCAHTRVDRSPPLWHSSLCLC
jgi:hypothetical protein